MPLDDLEALDPEYVRDTLSKPPFVSLPGVVNVRDLGSYPTKYPGMITKPNLLYRSGEISNITEEGVATAGRSPFSRPLTQDWMYRKTTPERPRNPSSLRPPLRHRNRKVQHPMSRHTRRRHPQNTRLQARRLHARDDGQVRKFALPPHVHAPLLTSVMIPCVIKTI